MRDEVGVCACPLTCFCGVFGATCFFAADWVTSFFFVEALLTGVCGAAPGSFFLGVDFGVPFFGFAAPAGEEAILMGGLPLLRGVDLDGVRVAEGVLVSLPLRAPCDLSATVVFGVKTSSSASAPDSGSRSELECSARSKSLSSVCLPDLRLLPTPSSRTSVP